MKVIRSLSDCFKRQKVNKQYVQTALAAQQHLLLNYQNKLSWMAGAYKCPADAHYIISEERLWAGLNCLHWISQTEMGPTEQVEGVEEEYFNFKYLPFILLYFYVNILFPTTFFSYFFILRVPYSTSLFSRRILSNPPLILFQCSWFKSPFAFPRR